MSEISQYLKSKSIGGDTAGMIQEGTFSVVHESDLTKDQISLDLSGITKNILPNADMELRIASVAAKPGSKLTKQDSARAILYTINNFAKSKGEDFSIHSLADGYQEMLTQTVETDCPLQGSGRRREIRYRLPADRRHPDRDDPSL